ncbi:MAG: DUF6265 family protein [Cyclobacteriaceae bacterium]
MCRQFLIACLVCLCASGVIAQAHTLSLNEGQSSPQASLTDIAWIQGHWKGEAFGGITEEIWTPPLGNSMMAAFKLVVDNKIEFYELITIVEEDETLIMRLKHFDKTLLGWEEKDKTIDFPLVKVAKDAVYFDGLTFESISESEMNVYVVISDEGETHEAKFNYRKAQ